MPRSVLITGVAGFVGFSLAKFLTDTTDIKVTGIDNINDYYDTQLKEDRLNLLSDKIAFFKRDINDDLSDIFEDGHFDCVINLAAQAGVRYSKKNPDVYIESNIVGFYNLMRSAQKFNIKKVIYASSSSIYGANKSLPFSESDQVSTPMSLYAATKLANENIASGFFYSFGIRTIGLRFFNIYGPYGRPDMAYFKWTDNIVHGRKIELNNNGEMWRDMTYIDDCVESIRRLILDDNTELSPEVYNIGNKDPVKIADLLSFISSELNTTPVVRATEAGAEEPIKTWANTEKLAAKINFSPNTDYQYGTREFIKWYKEYYD